MNEFDQFVKHTLRVKHYARYTDDFTIISSDQEYLRNLIALIESFLHERLALELHPQKVTIRKYSQGIDFLGYVLLPHHTRVRSVTKRRMVRKLSERLEAYKAGEIKEETLYGSLRSYLGVVSHANGYGLTEKILNAFWFRLQG